MASGTVKMSGGAPALLLRGTTLFYLGLVIILPMAALVVEAARPGAAAFWEALRDPYAWHALKLTFITALVMVVVNALTGTATTLGAGAWTTFRRVTLPGLWPSILTGAGLSFSRALGEFGSVVLVAGNQPLATKTAPLYIFGEIESGNRHGALVVSAVLLASSLLILVVLNGIQGRWGSEHGH
ncbi:MAG: ABC transporter permease subunit [Isosphaerales bacterium]